MVQEADPDRVLAIVAVGILKPLVKLHLRFVAPSSGIRSVKQVSRSSAGTPACKLAFDLLKGAKMLLLA